MPINVEELYRDNKQLKRSDVQQLAEWLKLQPHLPQIDELPLIVFLQSSNYSNEAAKLRIDRFFTIRTHCPEFFTNRDPLDKEMELCLKTVMAILMPQRTPEGYGVMYNRLIDPNPDNYNFMNAVKLCDMTANIYLREFGPYNGYVVILDVLGCTMMHLFKINLASVKKYMVYLQEALPADIKGIHYVNAVPFMDKILSMIKPFLKKEFIDVLHVHHGNNETLLNYLPKECIPSEVLGDGVSGMECHQKMIELLKQYRDLLLTEDKLIVDETKRPGKPTNTGDLFGVEGTFKRLDID